MPRALLIARCSTALAITLCLGLTLAEPPMDYGGMPMAQGVKYAGPIVYSNEKPPIIHFPPPPQGASMGGSGWGSRASSIKYIPLPHHDLPVLIYQSDSSPPIHVVSPPRGTSQPAEQYGPPRSEYGSPSKSDFGGQMMEYGPPRTEYGPPRDNYSPARQDSYGPPAKVEYGAPSDSYGPPKNEYGPPSGSPKPVYGPPKGSHTSSSEWRPGPPPGIKSGWGPPPPKRQQQQRQPHPHIIYTGHPPIHLLHQMPESPKSSWSQGPPSMGYTSSSPSMVSMSYGPPQGNSFGSSLSSFYGPPKSESSSSYGPPKSESSASYGPPKSMYGPPSRPSKMISFSYGPPQGGPQGFMRGPPPMNGPAPSYGPPSGGFSSQSYGPPSSSPSSSYGAPIGSPLSSYDASSQGPSSSYGAPSSEPLSSYGAPSNSGSGSSSYGAPSNEPSTSYGAASSFVPTVTYGPPQSDSFNSFRSFSHGAPKGGYLSSMMTSFSSHSPSYGPPKQFSTSASTTSYGPPKMHYGPPRMSYGPPKAQSKFAIAPKAWHKPPIIIYAGVKPPVHVYQKSSNDAWSQSESSPVSSSISYSNNGFGSQSSSSSSSSVSPDNVDITYGSSDSSSAGEVYLPSASAPRPTIIKPQSQPSLRTIYVSGLNAGGSGPYKTFLVTNSNPIKVEQIGYTSGPSPSPISISNSAHDMDTAASSISAHSSDSSPSIQKAEMIHEHVAESRILPTNDIFKNYRNIETKPEPTSESVENSSINVPLSLIIPTSSSIESVESFKSSVNKIISTSPISNMEAIPPKSESESSETKST